MKKTSLLRCGAIAAFALVALFVCSPVVFAQTGEAAATEASKPVWHYMGAALGLGMIAIGASLGIGKLAAAAAEGIARQPSAAAQITGAVNLPLFLLEGVAVIAEVVVLLMLFLK